MKRKEVSEKLGKHYSDKFTKETGKTAKVWAFYDESKRAYCIRGENLPAHPELQGLYPNGWTLCQHIKPAVAKAIINLPTTEVAK